jgi:putative ABC transport system permease protein
VRAGRSFNDADAVDAPPVVIVNETLARQAWPGLDAVGRRLRFSRDADAPWHTVVGVVTDVRHRGPSAPPRPEIYQPLGQRSFGSMAFVIRTAGDPSTLVSQVRREVAMLAPGLALSKVSTMEDHVERALSRPRFMSTLVAAFGALALALAVVGIYGVMSYTVTERTPEIAIRLALGARRSDVVGMVLGKAVLLSAVGITAGAAASWALTGMLAGLLFEIASTDAGTFVAASGTLLAIALLAAAVPAFRASRISGSSVLRS